MLPARRYISNAATRTPNEYICVLVGIRDTKTWRTWYAADVKNYG